MKHEPYAIREGFILFKNQLEECAGLLANLHTLPDILSLQKNFLFLSSMCKRQSLYIIEKTNANVTLSACNNSLMNIKSEFLDDIRSSDVIKMELININRMLSDLIASVDIKCSQSNGEMEQAENVQKTVERLEDFRAPAEFIQEYKDAVKDRTSKSTEEQLYLEINKRIKKESLLVKRTMEEGLTFVKGSIAINSYIRPFDLKGLNYSVLKIPGISFNHARKETITPIYIIHDQKLAVINVRKRRLSFKGTRYINPEEVFKERLNAIEASVNLVNQTKRFPTPYLMSPLFKNVRFLWFSENLEAFKNTKDGTVKLLW